jgi:23S rRNA (uracil-5-)-methyltransferase rumA
MKKGEEARGIISEYRFPDRGYIVREDGKVLVKHAVPGREVAYRVTKARKGSAEGRVLETLQPGACETRESRCPAVGSCGGCLYQTLPYEEELALKSELLERLLGEAVREDFLWEGLTPSPLAEGYRMKMEYSFGDAYRDGPLCLGMHKRGSHYDIVETDHCELVHEDFNLALRETLRFFREHNTPYYHKMRHEGYLRYLLVRRGTHRKELLLDLVTSSQLPKEEEEELLTAWRQRMVDLPFAATLKGVLHTVTDSVADAIKDERTEVLFGAAQFEEELSGLRFVITPFSFFQNNADGAELLYAKVGQYVGETGGKVVFDLYSGTGTIAQLVAKHAERTVGVELVEEAVIAARENAARNGVQNCRFIAGDVLKVLDEIEEKPDIIILDPPREGVNPKALRKLIRYGVPRIIYVSCKPSSLLTDLEILREGGYYTTRAAGVDMFPRTPGVEAVLLLEKK